MGDYSSGDDGGRLSVITDSQAYFKWATVDGWSSAATAFSQAADHRFIFGGTDKDGDLGRSEIVDGVTD